MNNGNLLNNLLSIGGATATATKATANKARAEASNKFQQALDQARPEVAARKPVERKDTAVSDARATTRSAPQRDSQQANNRADNAKKSSVAERDTQSKANVAADRPLKTDRPVDQVKAPEEGASVDQVIEAEPAQVVVEPESIQVLDPALVATEEPIEFIDPLATLSDLAEEALPTAATLESGDSDKPVIEPEIDETELLQDPGLLAGLLPVVSGAAANSDGEAVVGVAQAAAGQTDVLPLSGLISKALNVSTDEEAGTDPATGESESAMDGSDNPDFLLLNSKAALNKLAETNLTSSSLDKSAPAPELAKASPVGALVESLGRLNEAQSPAARAFVVQTGVQVPVGSPQWSQAVGDKVLWFAAQNVSSAEIRLDPPELGPMQVKVSVNQDQASITFTSPHPVVREALDQQLNRLREMFSEQGLNLLNVDVSDRSFAQQEREQGESSKGQDNSGLDDEELSPVAVTQIMSTRLVDHYA